MTHCAIVGFDQDGAGDWVALMACGHRQHVRHQPPRRERPGVLTGEGRAEHLGSSLGCPTCDEVATEDQLEGGDPACWANRVCADCGALDGHRPTCPNRRSSGTPSRPDSRGPGQ